MNSNFRRKKSFILFVCLKKAFTFARGKYKPNKIFENENYN